MATTIQISEDLQSKLAEKKLYERETYEEVIWDLIEDTQELNYEAKQLIAQSRAEVKEGKVKTLEQVKRGLGR
jgi:predicted CopG family antitoxin